MGAVSLSVARSLAALPVSLRDVVLDEAYAEATVNGMVLQAAVLLAESFDYQANPEPVFRNEWVKVFVSTYECVQACIVGQFVFVEF